MVKMLLLLQGLAALSPETRGYLRVTTARVILAHVEVIDGTGAAPLSDRNITIDSGRIVAITPGADQPAAEGTTVLDLRGYAVLPGIVGMHDHFWYLQRPLGYTGPPLYLDMIFSGPRLYLANGVTTMRTAGSVNPIADLRVKQAIEHGLLPGPHLDVSGPYLDGPATAPLLTLGLTGPDDARETVKFWAERGVTSFKAYTHITRDELRAAVAEAHAHGIKVTGHLCSVTYEEAIAAGIDNFEHGFSENTALDPDKKPDICSPGGGEYTLEHMLPGSAEADRLIALLVSRHVAITSTLAGRGMSLNHEPPPGAWDAMAAEAQDAVRKYRGRPVADSTRAKTALLLRREMDLERAFVAAGGLLMAGPDPVGIGGLLPGFGDHLEIELLVEAGFTPVEAIRIATLNGATFLGQESRIGSIAVGKNADLMVVKGDPAARIQEIENVEIVFKDGLGYDSAKLLESVKGHYGDY